MDNLLEKLPTHMRIEMELQDLLSSKPVGTKLLSENELAKKFNVSRPTIRKATDSLRNQGILVTYHGKGSYLSKPIKKTFKSRAKASKLLALVVPGIENAMIANIVKGVEREVRERGYNVILIYDDEDLDQHFQVLRQIISRGVDGLIVYCRTAYICHPEYSELLKSIVDKDIPLVLIDRYVSDIDLRCVMVDNYHGMYMATEHLILTGRRRLAFLCFGQEAEDANRDRKNGFFGALHDYQVDGPKYLAELGYANLEVYAKTAVAGWIEEYHGGRLPFDAIVCMQDNMAYGAYMALKEAGYSVPGDVALVGFDNLDRDIYKAHGLELTSVNQPAKEIGTNAASMLIEQIEGIPEVGPRHLLMKSNLVIRKSCGCGK